MKNALILHGAGNNSQGNWFPWLRGELEKNNRKVWSPDLPNPNTPDDNWIKTIFANKEWIFNDESSIVGHSAGATLILRILEKLPEKERIDKAVLVAGPIDLGSKPEYFSYKRGLVSDPFNWEKIKRSANNFYFIYSDNDPYDCGDHHGKKLKELLGGKLLIKRGEGHFNLEKSPNYRQFPLILELLRES